ncbi:SPRY domain-containing SOCS box protein 3-like [Drosophila takahashii]|uniref:SPRY domain-containing SOCS box protein 3-like n=1 Tax=Drosophila takahashii TaxID=29030 RepID=UPI001CF9223C|nr:SPRY domain-containing SOCS box protein 3-like [Drosophila takahashii]
MTQRYCQCWFPSSNDIVRYKGHIPDLVKCRCGEYGVGNGYSWQWDTTEESDALVTERDITFHPTRSQGTAIVKGKKSLEPGMVHYWEMLAISPLYGTDVMFGIGTQSIDSGQHRFQYVSALGSNAHSWGLSYSGQIQNCGERLPYAQKFSQGCLIGVYLDRSRGHLEFYINRKALGVAYTNVPVDPNVKIYPMVCSTALKSVIRLTNCTSLPDTLLLRSLQALSRKQLSELRKFPGFRSFLKTHWFLTL